MSRISASAGGQEEHPWLVNNSMTTGRSAAGTGAARSIAARAQKPFHAVAPVGIAVPPVLDDATTVQDKLMPARVTSG
jgi:hypothetical protein